MAPRNSSDAMRSACHLEMSKQQNSNPGTLGAKEIAGIIFPPPDEVRDGMWNLWTWEWQSPLIVHLVYFRPWTPSLMSFLRVSSDWMLSYPISQMSTLNPREIKQLGPTINNLKVRIWVLDCPAAKCEFNSSSLLRGKKKRYCFSFSISKKFFEKEDCKEC